jgi:SAM-dependent methyltransferase
MKNICPICVKKISESLAPYNDIGWTDFGIFKKLQLSHCSHCGFGFSVPELDEGTVGYFYEKQYRSKGSTFHIDFSKLKYNDGVRDIRSSRSFAQLTLARVFCKFENQDIFLDVGPGLGGSFKLAVALFEKPKLYAIELSEGASEYYKNSYNVICDSSLDDFISSGQKAQIILMSHSLEHYRVSDLPKLMLSLYSALDDNGVIVVEVPNDDLRFHLKNRGVDTPHFLFFSEESLALLFQKNSFEVLFIDTCGEEYLDANELLASELSSSTIKTYLKDIFNNFSSPIQNFLGSLVRTFRKIKNFKLIVKINPTFSLPNQSYGGERNSIRMVIRKK